MPMKGSKSGTDQSVGAVNEKRKKINARVLRKVDEVYKAFPTAAAGERKEGLVKYSEYLDKLLKRFNVLDGAGKPIEASLHAPRSKVSVMIVGNHSSGKSSFINWYINEKLLGTSMAIETKGLIFVTQGKVKDVWEKEGTLRKFPEIADIATELKDPAVVNCLETHFSQSDERLFSMVNFIDTPGLVDGHVEYPFDVNKGIVYMAKHVDKILIFLDPMGKATVTRTMDVIKALQEDYQEKTSFYMTKADQIDSQSDIMDVIAQTVRVSIFVFGGSLLSSGRSSGRFSFLFFFAQ
jgi:ribosome biogenesis GTPase A